MNILELKKAVNELILSSEESHARYMALQHTAALQQGDAPQYMRKAKIAFLSSFTIEGLPEIFALRAFLHNMLVETYLPGYNQFSQELLDTRSGLHSFEPDIIYILVDLPDILDERHLDSIVSAATAGSAARVVIANFVPHRAGEAAAKKLNKRLEVYTKDPKVEIFDLHAFITEQGSKAVWYTKYVELGDMRIAPSAFPQLAEKLLAHTIACTGATRKCIVTDLDNTLWEGVVGEVGPQGVVPNTAFQKWLLTHYEQGAILAINSKNNEADALEVFAQNKNMLVTLDHFAAWRINWEAKDKNTFMLAEELNIGTDSMVFIDDDPLQQHTVLHSLPEVAVLSPFNYGSFTGLTKSSVTEEDKRRGKMYIEERKRREFKSALLDEVEFLKRLDLEVSIRKMAEEDIARVSQLTQKTNQFNLTTKRLTEDEVREFAGTKTNDILVFEVKDAFGEYGVVGVCFLSYVEGGCRIDNFLMSCRVIGRHVERAFLSHIIDQAHKKGAVELSGYFIPTKKNEIARSFYVDNGFVKTHDGAEEQWRFNIKNDFSAPEYIRIIEL